MYVVGLTGGIGSGKSTVANFFQDLGIELVDADLLSREVVNPGTTALQRIAEQFGSDIITAKGELNRHRLREIIFADPAQKDWLETLLHPLIGELIQARLANCNSNYCILVSPLLLETRQHELVDRVLVVDASEQTQLARTLHRDESNELTIKAIIASQISREERLKRADDVLENENELALLKGKIATLHQQYLQKAIGIE